MKKDLKDFLPDLWKCPPEDKSLLNTHYGGDYFEMKQFVESVVNDTKSPIDVYEGLDMTVPGLVSQESINRNGAPLTVPDFRNIHRFPDDLPKELQNSSIIIVA